MKFYLSNNNHSLLIPYGKSLFTIILAVLLIGETLAQQDTKLGPEGIIIPTLDRTQIANPQKGQMLCDINSNTLWFYNGTTWVEYTQTGQNYAPESTDNGIATFQGTDGNVLQSSDVTIDEFNNVTIDKKIIVDSSPQTTYTIITVTDYNSVNLSNVLPGSLVETSGGSKGVVTSVNDPGNILFIDEWIPNQPTDGETFAVKAGGTLTVANFGIVPIGSIIDFWNAGGQLTLPDNFIKCNGQTINDPESPLNGVQLPNLNTYNGVYTIGSNNNAHNTYIQGNLNHNLPSHTHHNSHSHDQGTLVAAVQIRQDDIRISNAHNTVPYWAATIAIDGSYSFIPAINELYSSGADVYGNTGTYNGDTGGNVTSPSTKGASLPVWKVIRIK